MSVDEMYEDFKRGYALCQEASVLGLRGRCDDAIAKLDEAKALRVPYLEHIRSLPD